MEYIPKADIIRDYDKNYVIIDMEIGQYNPPDHSMWMNTKIRSLTEYLRRNAMSENTLVPAGGGGYLRSDVSEWLKNEMGNRYEIIKCIWTPIAKNPSKKKNQSQIRYGIRFENDGDLIYFKLAWS